MVGVEWKEKKEMSEVSRLWLAARPCRCTAGHRAWERRLHCPEDQGPGRALRSPGGATAGSRALPHAVGWASRSQCCEDAPPL